MKRSITIPSKVTNINLVEPFLKKFFAENSLPEQCFVRTLISVSECVNNSIVHGNENMEEKNVQIQLVLHGSQLIIQIEDEGNGFDLQDVKDPTLPENIKMERGRGIFLVKKLADEVKFLEGGCKVQIKFQIQREHSVL